MELSPQARNALRGAATDVINGRATGKRWAQVAPEVLRLKKDPKEYARLKKAIAEAARSPELAGQFTSKDIDAAQFLFEADVRETVHHVDALKDFQEKTQEKKGPLGWAWEKAKAGLSAGWETIKWPFKNPGKTALALAVAYLAAPQILNIIASTEFAATRPEVLRVIEYLQSFLTFGTGGTGVKAGAIAGPLS